MQIVGQTPEEIIEWVIERYPRAYRTLTHVSRTVPFYKRQIDEFQGYVLYALASGREGEILEIGTAWGYSAAIIADAAPAAQVVTLNPKVSEFEVCSRTLNAWSNVVCRAMTSWDHLAMLDERFPDKQYSMIFVDGDHGRVWRDLPYWERVAVGGLMLFHDYTPHDAKRPCQPVYEVLNQFAQDLGHGPDVLVVDDGGTGMAGFIKQPDDGMPTLAWYEDWVCTPDKVWMPESCLQEA